MSLKIQITCRIPARPGRSHHQAERSRGWVSERQPQVDHVADPGWARKDRRGSQRSGSALASSTQSWRRRLATIEAQS